MNYTSITQLYPAKGKLVVKHHMTFALLGSPQLTRMLLLEQHGHRRMLYETTVGDSGALLAAPDMFE